MHTWRVCSAMCVTMAVEAEWLIVLPMALLAKD